MGKGDNRLTPLVKKRTAQRKKNLKIKKLISKAISSDKSLGSNPKDKITMASSSSSTVISKKRKIKTSDASVTK